MDADKHEICSATAGQYKERERTSEYLETIQVERERKKG